MGQRDEKDAVTRSRKVKRGSLKVKLSNLIVTYTMLFGDTEVERSMYEVNSEEFYRAGFRSQINLREDRVGFRSQADLLALRGDLILEHQATRI